MNLRPWKENIEQKETKIQELLVEENNLMNSNAKHRRRCELS